MWYHSRRIRIYFYLMVAIFLFSQPLFILAEDWGIPLGNLHCRLELQKEIFLKGEDINLGFRVEALNESKTDAHNLITYEKRGLIENLQIVGPDGKKLPLKTQPIYPPSGRLYTSFNVSYYYEFEKHGEYSITAEYPLESNWSTILQSQTVSLFVVPNDTILISIGNGTKKFRTTDHIPIFVNLSTGCDDTIELENVKITFKMENLWSCPLKNGSVPSKVALTKEVQTYTFDLSSTGWDFGFSSIWPAKQLATFIKPSDKKQLVCEISGNYKGKRFEVKSKPVIIEFF